MLCYVSMNVCLNVDVYVGMWVYLTLVTHVLYDAAKYSCMYTSLKATATTTAEDRSVFWPLGQTILVTYPHRFTGTQERGNLFLRTPTAVCTLFNYFTSQIQGWSRTLSVMLHTHSRRYILTVDAPRCSLGLLILYNWREVPAGGRRGWQCRRSLIAITNWLCNYKHCVSHLHVFHVSV